MHFLFTIYKYYNTNLNIMIHSRRSVRSYKTNSAFFAKRKSLDFGVKLEPS